MLNSEFLNRFKKLEGVGDDVFILHGDRMLVEVMPKEELTTKGGLIISSDSTRMRTDTTQNRPLIVTVLAVGKGYIEDVKDEDGEVIDHVQEEVPYKPGEVLFISDLSIKYLSEFPGLGATGQKLGIVRATETHISWPSFEAYEKFKSTLNG